MPCIDRTDEEAYELCWGRGDTKRRILTIKSSAGVALDVSGSAFLLTVDSLKNPPSGGATEQFAITGVFVTDGTNGQVYFAPAPGDTDIPAAGYFYDLQETDANAEIETVYKARCKIVQDITK